MNNKKLLVIVSCLLLVVFAISACGPSSTAPSSETNNSGTTNSEQTSSEANTTTSSETIKFAVAAPMTGDTAEFGKIVLDGVTVAVDEINKTGGIEGKQIVIDSYDDKCDSTEAASVASKIASDPDVFAVIGHMCSGATMAAAPIYEKAGIVYLTASSSRTDLTKQGFKYLFRSLTHDAGYGPILAQLALKNFCAKNIAIVYTNNDYGIGLLATVKEEIAKLNGNIVAEETFRAGDKDFSAQLSKIANAKADLILLITEYTEGALIARQRAAAGLGDVQIVASSTMQFPQFIELGGDYVEGAVVGAAWDRWGTQPEVKAFNDKWNQIFGQPADELNSYYYDAVYIMKQAIEEGATKETLGDVLRKIHHTGNTGVVEFDETGEVKPKQLYALQIKNGEFTSFDLTQASTCE